MLEVGQDGRGGAAPGRGWLVTFGDLMALLLAFFVLLVSMTEIRTEAWRQVAGSLAARLSTGERTPGTAPTAARSVPRAAEPAGADLGYLRALLRERLEAAAPGFVATPRHAGDRLMLPLPAGRLFVPGRTSARADAAALLAPLAATLRLVGNRVDVVAYGEPSADPATRVESTLARATAVAVALRQAGYDRDLRVFASLAGAAGSVELAIRAAADQEQPGHAR